jgi:8-oxo-dGTP pyrophosphatase MutT (NUDIX family)/GNAT superfamily N-acetyltransferase
VNDVVVPWEAGLSDGTVALLRSSDDPTTTFHIHVDTCPAGVIGLNVVDSGYRAVLHVELDPTYRGRGFGSRAVRLLIRYAFEELGLERIEAYIAADDAAARWTASRAGLRREGLARGWELVEGGRRDMLVYARLRDDPDPTTTAGRVALANAGLPYKRVVAKVLVRDERGRILMTQGPFGGGWDLPGGVVESGETPRAGGVREVYEELDLDLSDSIGRLLLVDWLPPKYGWDDACLLVFDGGTQESSIVGSMTLQASEIGDVEFVEPEEAVLRALLPTAECLPQVLNGAPGIVYLEDHRPV